MKPGVYFDMPFEEYQKAPGFSQSLAKPLEECPAMCKYEMDNPTNKDSASLRIGRAVHQAVFEKDRFDSLTDFAVSRKYGRTKAEMEERARFEGENASKTILSEQEYEEAKAISSQVLSCKTVSSLIAKAKSEVSIFWKDPSTDVLCKGRVDCFNQNEKVIIDLKTTTQSLADESLSKLIALMRYHRQVAWYTYGLSCLDINIDLALFVFVQKKPPYPVRVKALDVNDVEQGVREMKELLKVYKLCSETGYWPGYPDEIETITLPTWARKDEEFTYEEGEMNGN
jgi:hypothetical protein